ncbi:MAG: hypothetical protein QGH07_15560 [Alphaproteobacteria bacterium]|nr:hypothetical protein [Alphaproteobacteria bacterium]
MAGLRTHAWARTLAPHTPPAVRSPPPVERRGAPRGLIGRAARVWLPTAPHLASNDAPPMTHLLEGHAHDAAFGRWSTPLPSHVAIIPAFRFATALKPRRKEYTLEDVLGAVGSLHPAIEIPDSRFENFATVGEAQLIADNACAHEFILGPAAEADWRAIDLSQHKATIKAVGGEVHDGIGANVLGDPRDALLWLVQEITGLGLTIEAGQVVTTGTCAEPLDIEPGDEVIADFGTLGDVNVSFDG